MGHPSEIRLAHPFRIFHGIKRRKMEKTKPTATTAILVTLLACVAGFGVLMAYFADKYQNERNTLQAEIKELKGTSATVTDTSDWKTYTSKELGFTFKYPKIWALDVESVDDGIVYLLTEERQKQLDNDEKVSVFDVMFQKYDSIKGLPNNSKDEMPLSEWVNDNYSAVKTATVNGINGYTGTAKESAGTTSYVVFVQKGTAVYQLEASDVTELGETHQAIFDSFEFL